MPLRPFNDLGDLNLRAMEYRNEQLRNDLSNFYSGAKNAALSGIAGFAGQLGDFEGLIQKVLASPLAYAKPNKKMVKPPTSEEVAKYIGADLNTPSGWMGQIGMPDAGDLLKIGGLGVKGAMVFAHGSPHKFDAFDMSKIGTGEGAQAFGHGLYFAEDSKVAGAYAEHLGGANYAFKDGNPIKDNPDLSWAIEAVKRNPDDPEAFLLQMENNNYGLNLSAAKKMLPEVKKMKDISYGEMPGNLYEVDIPDDQVAKMLDWDKPLSEQPEGVQKALTRLSEIAPDKDIAKYMLANPQMTGGAIYGGIASGFADSDAGRRGASRILNELGIPGIKYLDGTSRTAGEGTRNVVIFDDKLAKILTRNGQPIK